MTFGGLQFDHFNNAPSFVFRENKLDKGQDVDSRCIPACSIRACVCINDYVIRRKTDVGDFAIVTGKEGVDVRLPVSPVDEDIRSQAHGAILMADLTTGSSEP